MKLVIDVYDWDMVGSHDFLYVPIRSSHSNLDRGRVDTRVDTSKGNQELVLPLTGKGAKGKITLELRV